MPCLTYVLHMSYVLECPQCFTVLFGDVCFKYGTTQSGC